MMTLDSIHLPYLIDIGFQNRASDVLIKAHHLPTMRQFSVMQPLPGEYPVLTPEACERLVNEMMNERQRRIFEETSEMDIAFQVEGKCRVRMNIYRQRGTCASVM